MLLEISPLRVIPKPPSYGVNVVEETKHSKVSYWISNVLKSPLKTCLPSKNFVHRIGSARYHWSKYILCPIRLKTQQNLIFSWTDCLSVLWFACNSSFGLRTIFPQPVHTGCERNPSLFWDLQYKYKSELLYYYSNKNMPEDKHNTWWWHNNSLSF